jgi:hypothetical protein
MQEMEAWNAELNAQAQELQAELAIVKDKFETLEIDLLTAQEELDQMEEALTES